MKLVDKSGGADATALPASSLEGATSFTKLPSAALDPSDLKLGHTYQLQISTQFESGAAVLPGGSAGYDNIALKAITTRGGGNHGNGHDGHNGHNGTDGADGAGGVISNTVKVKGKFVVAKVRCGKQAPKRKCKSKLNARLSKKGPQVTSTQKARVKAGRTEKVKLRIRGKYRKDVSGAKRLTIKRKTRVAGKTTTTYKAARIKG